MRFWIWVDLPIKFLIIACSSPAVEFIGYFLLYLPGIGTQWCFAALVEKAFLQVMTKLASCKCFVCLHLQIFADSLIFLFIHLEFCVVYIYLVSWRSCCICGKVLQFTNFSTETTFVKDKTGQVCSFLFSFYVLFSCLLIVNDVVNQCSWCSSLYVLMVSVYL